MWTAEVTSKEIVNGLLKVTVSFTNGTETFTDRYETRSGQDADWLSGNINRRLADLESVYIFEGSITLGVFNPTVIPAPPVNEGKELYKQKLEEFNSYVNAISKGIIADTNADFVACQTWLQDNFNPDYVDLF